MSKNKFLGIHEDDRLYRIAKEFFFHIKIVDSKRGLSNRLIINNSFKGQRVFCSFITKFDKQIKVTGFVFRRNKGIFLKLMNFKNYQSLNYLLNIENPF